MAIMAGAFVDVADFSDTGWLDDDITWASGFEDYNPSVASNHFEYRRIGSVVYLRGLVRRITSNLSPSSTATMFTMPTGFRPSRNVVMTAQTRGVWTTLGASTGTAHTHAITGSNVTGPTARITVNSTGVIQVLTDSGVTLEVDNWVSMGTISYLVDL